jgi:hypothetical protein
MMSADDFERRLGSIWDAIGREPVESIRLYGEWLVAMGILRFGCGLEDLLGRLQDYSVPASMAISLISVLGIVGGSATGSENGNLSKSEESKSTFNATDLIGAKGTLSADEAKKNVKSDHDNSKDKNLIAVEDGHGGFEQVHGGFMSSNSGVQRESTDDILISINNDLIQTKIDELKVDGRSTSTLGAKGQNIILETAGGLIDTTESSGSGDKKVADACIGYYASKNVDSKLIGSTLKIII